MTVKRPLLAVAALVLMMGLLASACVRFAGDVAGSRCECPILIETAPTIDFIGDGQTPIRVSSYLAEDPRPLQVDLMYNIAYSDETVIEIAERFVDAGFETISGFT